MKKVIITMVAITIVFCLCIVALRLSRTSNPQATALGSLTSYPLEKLHINAEGKLNINTATVQELTALNGIGDVLAQRIVEYREKYGPYRNTQDLLNIAGIGPAKLNNIIEQIYVE